LSKVKSDAAAADSGVWKLCHSRKMSGTSARYKTTITHSPMTIHLKSNCRIEDGAGAEAACRDSATCTAASSSAEATATTTDGHGSDALGAHLDAVPLYGISV